MSETNADSVTAALLAHRAAFKAFLVSRVGNEADAEDLLQTGLIKAFAHAPELHEQEKAVAWFYQLLRHAVIDQARSRSAAQRRDHTWSSETAVLAAADPAATREICGCFESLLPTMKPVHAELLRRVELNDEPVSAVAAAMGLTPNHASVLLHRARTELRNKLVHFCGPCAESACLDCDCSDTPDNS